MATKGVNTAVGRGAGDIDLDLLGQFRDRIESKMPRILDGGQVYNPTPLVEITDVLLAAAKDELGLDLGSRGLRVYGKMEGRNPGGSVKTRPAIRIVSQAIASGAITRDTVVFEATSGNFGMALGLLNELGLKVIVLVSRRLQDGVLRALDSSNVKAIDLDVDICPAPGMPVDPGSAVSKGIAQFVRGKLIEYGLEAAPFDRARAEVEALLARQDVMGLSKLLAKAYGGFCPEQYDNELNPESHSAVTGPEIEAQLRDAGCSLADFEVVCTFGTGGTSTGLSRYFSEKYGRKGVRVVFPLEGQDVAGIRTKARARGLRFYRPDLYLGEHEVDFQAAKRLMNNLLRRGLDLGESSALALYATLQLANYGAGGKFVVVLADEAKKYADRPAGMMKAEVSLEEARSPAHAYDAIVWTHGMFTLKEEGVRLLAESLGCDPAVVKVARTGDVRTLLNTGEVPQGMHDIIPVSARHVLVVCMVGGTSLMAAKRLGTAGVVAQSLRGGIMGVIAPSGRPPAQLLKQGD